MRGNIFRVSLIFFVVLALSIALSSLAGGKTALANGAGHEVVKNAKAGPYELQVSILPGSPKVGNLHLSILVKNAETGAAITDATVMVAATGPLGATNVSPMQAVNTPQGPQFYDVDIPLDTAGKWTLTVDTDSSLGKANLGLSLEVAQSRGTSLLWMAAGIVAALAFGLGTWDMLRSRRRRRKQKTSRG